jgi:hypothetical protein
MSSEIVQYKADKCKERVPVFSWVQFSAENLREEVSEQSHFCELMNELRTDLKSVSGYKH